MGLAVGFVTSFVTVTEQSAVRVRKGVLRRGCSRGSERELELIRGGRRSGEWCGSLALARGADNGARGVQLGELCHWWVRGMSVRAVAAGHGRNGGLSCRLVVAVLGAR